MVSGAEFESIAGASGFHDFEVSGNGCYCDDFLQHFYSGWQASRQALEGGSMRGYSYELASCTNEYGEYCNWSLSISHQKPSVPPDAIRNLEALYTHPASAATLQFGNGNLVVTDGSFDDVPAVFISPAIDLGNAPDTALSGKDAERRTDMLYGDETVLLFKTAEHASVVAGALIRGNDASNYRLTLGQRKAAQIGETIGVLAQNQEGRVCAVTDLGRCTWLSEDVTGANHKYNRDSDEAMGKKLSVYPEPTKADEPPSVPEEWRTTMKELADDLESEIEARRSGDLDRRIERDLIVVKEARVLLDEQEQGGPTKSALKPSGFGDMNDMELQELANTCRRAKQDQG